VVSEARKLVTPIGGASGADLPNWQLKTACAKIVCQKGNGHSAIHG
jgi:hypothetical protein